MADTNLPPHQLFLQTVPFFASLPQANCDAFVAQAKPRHYSKHQNIFYQGDPADRLYVVMDGWVKMYRSTPSGDEAVMSVLPRGSIFGEIASRNNGVYKCSAQAAENLSLIEFPLALLWDQAEQNPAIMTQLLSLMSREIEHLQIENEHLSTMNTVQRVGCLLLQLSSDMNGKGATFSFPYDKSLAAARLGMKPETFSRALAQLSTIGVEVRGSDVVIHSFEQLMHYACQRCSSGLGECRNKAS